MTDWHAYAACADGVDPDWFFPDVPGLAGNKAKAICRGCLVRQDCLIYALHRPVQGIWGGTTQSQRVIMRRNLGIELPQRWAARKHRSRWEERYHEMIDLGYNQVQIAQRWNIKPASLVRQLGRYGIPPSEQLLNEANSTKAGQRAS